MQNMFLCDHTDIPTLVQRKGLGWKGQNNNFDPICSSEGCEVDANSVRTYLSLHMGKMRGPPHKDLTQFQPQGLLIHFQGPEEVITVTRQQSRI